MAFTANSVKPVKFLRRPGFPEGAPIYEFPVGNAGTVFRPMNLLLLEDTGKVVLCTGAAGFARPGDGAEASAADSGIAGFFAGGSTSSPPFPSSAGNQGAWTSPNPLTTNDPIPATEKVPVIMTLPDLIFEANLGTSAANVEADTNVSTRTILGVREGLSVCTAYVLHGDTNIAYIDISATTNTARPLNYAYPQPPATRGTTASGDPYLLQGAAVINARVEFHVIDSMWDPLA